jgi:hypothetical protein
VLIFGARHGQSHQTEQAGSPGRVSTARSGPLSVTRRSGAEGKAVYARRN